MGFGRFSLKVAAVLIHLGKSLDTILPEISKDIGLRVPDNVEQKTWVRVGAAFSKTSMSCPSPTT
jgi:hypothetical protein